MKTRYAQSYARMRIVDELLRDNTLNDAIVAVAERFGVSINSATRIVGWRKRK